MITGDSHLAALDSAVNNDSSLTKGHNVSIRPLGNSEASYNPYFSDGQKRVDITLDRYKSHLTSIPPEDEQPDVIVISMVFHTLRFIRQTKLWEDFTPATLGQAKKHSLSVNTFKKMVLTQQQYNIELLQKLKDLGISVVALESPKLFSHHNAFKKHAPEIIMEVDRQYRETIRERLVAQDIAITHCPPDTYDMNTGLMKPEYRTNREEDQHHANIEYGALVMRKLISDIEKTNSISQKRIA